MLELIKSIFKKIIRIILPILVSFGISFGILFIMYFMSTGKNKSNDSKITSKLYTGIEDISINYEIIEEDVFCEKNIKIELSGYNNFKYLIERNISIEDIEKLEIKINNKKINYAPEMLKSGDENYLGKINKNAYITLNLLEYSDSTTIYDKNLINIYIKYKEPSKVLRFKNTDAIKIRFAQYFFVGENLKNFSYINNLNIGLKSDTPITNAKINFEKLENIQETSNFYQASVNKNIKDLISVDDIYLSFNLNDEGSKDVEFFDISYDDFKYENLETKYENKKIEENKRLEEENRRIEEQNKVEEKIYIEKYQALTKKYFIPMFIISVLMLIISLYINGIFKKVTKYTKSCEGLVPPSLAEIIIDGKTDLKSLLMASIIDFHIRGNIRILDNNSIEFITTKNTEEYERKILNLLFGLKKIIKFEDINEKFKRSAEETKYFSDRLSDIRNSITNKLYDLNIFSKKEKLVSEILSMLSITFLITIPLIMYNESFWIIGFTVFIGLLILSYMDKKSTYIYMIETPSKSKIKIKITLRTIFSLVIVLILFIKGITKLLSYGSYLFIFLFLIFIINIYIISFNSGPKLTQKGKQEKQKLLQLNKYIKDYSLIKDRDLTSVNVWDDYLAYATSFGIPNKVTDSIYENWYNLNMTLQFVDESLDFLLK